jgi:uncharacterized protein YcaQ
VTAPATPDLSAREARRIALRAQGLLGPRIAGGPLGMLHHLRAVQLDTISVLARSHELVAYARLGTQPRRRIEDAYWGRRRGSAHANAFEYWAHAACVIPMADWPHFAFARAARRARGRRWHRLEDAERVCAEVRKKLESEGPLTAKQLGGAKRGGPWWDWSDVKIAVEWMLDIGDVVCTTRAGFQRVYDLPERAIPPDLLRTELSRDDQIAHLLGGAVRALGVATAGDVAAYCGLATQVAARTLAGMDVDRVTVERWSKPAFADPAALAASTSGLRSRPVLLSPFDSTMWYRPRVEQVFGFRHRLEAYVPRDQRVHGYFSMPVLAGDELVARVDPARVGGALVARSVHLEPGVPLAAASRAVVAALREAAGWVGATSVALERVEPTAARALLERELRARTA